MPFLPGDTSSSPRSSLCLPASKRISTPNAERLTTITEGSDANAAPAIPRRSSRRLSASHSEANGQRNSSRWSKASRATQRTAPPPYDWVPEPIPDSASNGPVVDEALEKLRRGECGTNKPKRGGWRRAAVIVMIVLLVVVALAAGLGVGLTRGKHHSDSSNSNSGSMSTTPPQKFPLGEYSLVTALRSVDTGCTSNPATWACYPFSTYDPSSSYSTGLASFNWIISNTSASYATNQTGPTAVGGIPANLTVSTVNDPFGITFDNQTLMYVFDSSNSTSQRYTLEFTLPKTVIPSTAITADDSNAKCFFNQTVFSASIYLSAARDYPSGDTSASASYGGYEQWPYAVEIMQTATGGIDVPLCHKTVDGRLGDQITAGLTTQPDSATCACDYRNF